MVSQRPAVDAILVIIFTRIAPILFFSTVTVWDIIRECAPKISDVASVRMKATWPLIVNTSGTW